MDLKQIAFTTEQEEKAKFYGRVVFSILLYIELSTFLLSFLDSTIGSNFKNFSLFGFIFYLDFKYLGIEGFWSLIIVGAYFYVSYYFIVEVMIPSVAESKEDKTDELFKSNNDLYNVIKTFNNENTLILSEYKETEKGNVYKFIHQVKEDEENTHVYKEGVAEKLEAKLKNLGFINADLDHNFDEKGELYYVLFLGKQTEAPKLLVKAQIPQEIQKLTKTLEIKNRHGIYPLILDYKVDGNGLFSVEYSYVDGISNFKVWQDNNIQIADYLGEIVEIEQGKKSIILNQAFELPEPEDTINENPLKYLKKDEIYLGFSTRGHTYYPLKELIHTLIAGQTESGKGNVFHLIMLSILYNWDKVDRFFGIDLKGGVELGEYGEDLGEKATVVDNIYDLYDLVKWLEIVMDARLEYMKKQKLKKWQDGMLIVAFDEYADIEKDTELDPMKKREMIESIERIARRARAVKMFLFITLQDPTEENISSGLKRQLPNKFMLKIESKHMQTYLLGSEIRDHFGVDPRNFPKGRFYGVDKLNKKYYIQSLYVKEGLYKEVLKDIPEEDKKAKEGTDITEEIREVLNKKINSENIKPNVKQYYLEKYGEEYGLNKEKSTGTFKTEPFEEKEIKPVVTLADIENLPPVIENELEQLVTPDDVQKFSQFLYGQCKEIKDENKRKAGFRQIRKARSTYDSNKDLQSYKISLSKVQQIL